IEAARGETKLVGIGLTDTHSVNDVIWAAFQRDVAPWAELQYAQDVVPPRVLAHVKDPNATSRPDVLIVGSPASFLKAGVSQPFANPYASRYPRGWTEPTGHWLPLYVQPIVVISNQHHVSALPRTWTDLTESGWAGTVVFEE